MPRSAASVKPTLQRWPVTVSLCACAVSIAAFSSARVMNMYALNVVAPSEIQYSTVRFASSALMS